MGNNYCRNPHKYYRCKNTGVVYKNNTLIHVMEVVFLKPIDGITVYSISTIPVPVSNNKYEFIDIDKLSFIAKLGSDVHMFKPESCFEYSGTKVCKFGNEDRYTEYLCILALYEANTENIEAHCVKRDFSGPQCIVQEFNSQLFISTFEEIKIFNNTQNTKNIYQSNPEQVCKGCCQIKRINNYVFSCDHTVYNKEYLGIEIVEIPEISQNLTIRNIKNIHLSQQEQFVKSKMFKVDVNIVVHYVILMIIFMLLMTTLVIFYKKCIRPIGIKIQNKIIKYSLREIQQNKSEFDLKTFTGQNMIQGPIKIKETEMNNSSLNKFKNVQW